MNIPAQNDMNLPGQNNPPNPVTTKDVASINNQVIGTPNNIKAHRQSLAQFQINGPFTCIHTSI